jgi:hypothetical protein
VIEATAGNPSKSSPDLEVLAYCYAAIISTLDIAVIQNQHDQIAALIKTHLLGPNASDYTCKYGVMALQFLLHSKTQA